MKKINKLEEIEILKEVALQNILNNVILPTLILDISYPTNLQIKVTKITIIFK